MPDKRNPFFENGKAGQGRDKPPLLFHLLTDSENHSLITLLKNNVPEKHTIMNDRENHSLKTAKDCGSIVMDSAEHTGISPMENAIVPFIAAAAFTRLPEGLTAIVRLPLL